MTNQTKRMVTGDYITYTGRDEVIVTTPANDKAAIRMWFTDGGRDLEEYDRNTVKDYGVCIIAGLKVD